MERKRKLDVDTSVGAGEENNGSELNYFTGKPYSTRYHDILVGRKGTCSVQSSCNTICELLEGHLDLQCTTNTLNLIQLLIQDSQSGRQGRM